MWGAVAIQVCTLHPRQARSLCRFPLEPRTCAAAGAGVASSPPPPHAPFPPPTLDPA